MLAAALASILVVGPARHAAADEEPSPWRFETELYAWIPGMYGTVNVKGHTARLDVTPGDLLSAVFDGDALAAAGYFSVAYDRWSAFADVFGGGGKQDVDEIVPTPFCNLSVNAKDRMRFVIADFALGYELGRFTLPRRRQPLRLGVYAGARYVYLYNKLRGGIAVIGGQQYGGTTSDSLDWADPIVGVRWSVPLLDAVSSTFRADVGGFGASSKLDWGLVFDVRYWLSWHPWSTEPYLAAGYRLVAFDRSPGASTTDLQMRGPLAGMGFTF